MATDIEDRIEAALTAYLVHVVREDLGIDLSVPTTCPSHPAWCWVRPADALTGAVVRCCERPYAFVKWTGGRIEKREWYWMCDVRRVLSEGRCA